jgi:hypothetical protein
MKVLCTVVLALGAAACTGAAPKPIPPISDISTKISTVAQQKDVQDALEVLEEIQTIPSWGWGITGGVGPIDRAYMAGNALISFESFLPWRREVAAELQKEGTSPVLSWLRTTVENREAMRAMLSSEDPLARWIALEKIANSSELPAEFSHKIRAIAANDDRLMILRKEVQGSRFAERVFDAPLRRAAFEILARAGEEPPKLDQRMLDIEGLAWLASIYLRELDDREVRFRISSALLMLAPMTPEIINAQEGMDITMPPERWLARFQALAQGSGRIPANGPTTTKSNIDGPSQMEGTARQVPSPVAVELQSQAVTQPTGDIAWPWIVAAAALLSIGLVILRVGFRRK